MSQWHHARVRWCQRRGFSGRSSARRKGGKHIPESWKDYLPVGQQMPGTCFIAFKVPLKKSFEKNLLQKNVFPPCMFFNKIQEQNEELGLIIDLTYTHRYYKPEDLPESIPYLNICTVGHPVPDDDTIIKFQCAVSGFLKENKDNGELIGVHCTPDLNRTGYLICRYLIDTEGMRPDAAIGCKYKAFHYFSIFIKFEVRSPHSLELPHEASRGAPEPLGACVLWLLEPLPSARVPQLSPMTVDASVGFLSSVSLDGDVYRRWHAPCQ
ncbi:RNA/RNP complex-1-interacting phosphatase-like [Mesoplodon densirostris]|uniref:RNA/RNP complex-1-interacting phosphatase-like n=1 Tax=Mesoplodon densirostris TaxID=48708 RepID=UPI0028DB8DFC|nr:RNA/RNP complex-1-interacting phosphatase-like [Mesoplodon densirostris]